MPLLGSLESSSLSELLLQEYRSCDQIISLLSLAQNRSSLTGVLTPGRFLVFFPICLCLFKSIDVKSGSSLSEQSC